MVDDPMSRIGLAGEPHAWQEAAREYLQAANYLLDWHDLSRVAPDAPPSTRLWSAIGAHGAPNKAD